MVALRFYRGALAPGAPLLPMSMLHSNRVHATIRCDYNRVCHHAITSLVTVKNQQTILLHQAYTLPRSRLCEIPQQIGGHLQLHWGKGETDTE